MNERKNESSGYAALTRPTRDLSYFKGHTQYRVRGLPIQPCQSEYITFPVSFMWGTQIFVSHGPTPAIGPKGRTLK
jgi:hypothetical protein